MKKMSLCCGLLLLVALPARAEKPASPKVIKESWDAAYLEGAKVGSFQSRVLEFERDGSKVFRTSVTMNMAIKRYNAVVPLRMLVGTEEAEDGKVVGLFMTQFLDKGKVSQTAKIEGGKLLLHVGQETKELPWDNQVVGMYRQERLFQEKKVAAGDKFTYRNYELSLLSPVTVRITVKEPEEVDLLLPGREGKKTQRVKKKLLRVEGVPDKIEIGGNLIPLPKMVSWLNDDREVVRSQMELPGLGTVTLYRTTKAIAQEEGAAPSLLPDLGLTTLIPLNRPINKPHDASSIVYRVTVKGDDDPGSTFVKDSRQTVRNVDGNTFELIVKAVRGPKEIENPAKPKEDFLKSSYFLDSKDERIRELTAQAVGNEENLWKKARRIEKWVHDRMKPNSAIGFITASTAARDLQGDCRQHAMLTAAMCRAGGVPARTAVGLVYVPDPERGPVLGFHMWTEVFIDGQWLGLDATLGQGSVGPAHLKISSPSWNDTQTLAPLLPVTRVMGKLKVEVVNVRQGKK